MKHGYQPIVTVNGVQRFQANAIVCYLLECGPFDMNHLAKQGFDEEDAAHFAQLIGYSVSRWGSLSYVSDEMWSEAQAAQTLRKDVQRQSTVQCAIEAIDNTIASLAALRDVLTDTEDLRG